MARVMQLKSLEKNSKGFQIGWYKPLNQKIKYFFKLLIQRIRKLEEVAKHEQLPAHPNCVKFYRAWEEKQRLYICLELCETRYVYNILI